MATRQGWSRLGIEFLRFRSACACQTGGAGGAWRPGRSSLGAGQTLVYSPIAGARRGFADYPPHQKLMMPSLSPTMTQGNIAAWLKKEGDTVAPGDVLAEVETDKATIEWEAQEEGIIARILAPAGSKDLAVGTPVAVLVEEADQVAAFADYSPDASGSPAPAAPAPAAAAPPPPSSSFPPHEVVNMPALSPTMTQGNIVAWSKKAGDEIAPGDALCEVETDKATITWEAQEEGFLAVVLAGDGAKDVAVGAPVAVIVESADLVAAFANFTAADAAGAPPAPAPAASAPPPPPPSSPAAAPVPATAPAAAPRPATVAPGARVVASPYAKKLAAGAGVSLAGAAGSGPGGRIVAADVHALIASGGGKAAAAATAAAPAGASAGAAVAFPAPAEGGYTDLQLNQIKRVTAARLLESKLTIPHYYLTAEVEVDALLALRAQVNSALAEGGTKLSVNDFIIKAAALALKKVPTVNSSWRGDYIRQFHSADVNVAVMTPAGLMVPFVANADAKGLAAISAEVKDLAARAKEGKLAPAEFMGGTFTISNLGMYGIKQFAAIVNPPQAAILAVGAASKVVLPRKDGGYREASVMLVTLSCDHRVIDGAVGAEWLQTFKHLVQQPLSMMV